MTVQIKGLCRSHIFVVYIEYVIVSKIITKTQLYNFDPHKPTVI